MTLKYREARLFILFVLPLDVGTIIFVDKQAVRGNTKLSHGKVDSDTWTREQKTWPEQTTKDLKWKTLYMQSEVLSAVPTVGSHILNSCLWLSFQSSRLSPQLALHSMLLLLREREVRIIMYAFLHSVWKFQNFTICVCMCICMHLCAYVTVYIGCMYLRISLFLLCIGLM